MFETDTAVRIAHISDLHFGAKGYADVSDSLAEYIRLEVKPDLVLVSGDLVDTPNKIYFDEVHNWLERLNEGLGWKSGERRRYLVCAGNHDRHKNGNALPGRGAVRLFEQHFPVHTTSDPFIDWFGEKPHRWRVRVISIDTSIRAKYSAQAFLGETDLRPIRDLKEWDDSEEPPFLVLMLAHHHLLPIPATEREVQSAWDLLKLTSAVACTEFSALRLL